MAHPLSQHVDRCAAVRVTLGVAVPVIARSSANGGGCLHCGTPLGVRELRVRWEGKSERCHGATRSNRVVPWRQVRSVLLAALAVGPVVVGGAQSVPAEAGSAALGAGATVSARAAVASGDTQTGTAAPVSARPASGVAVVRAAPAALAARATAAAQRATRPGVAAL